jgi:hypothetical protein
MTRRRDFLRTLGVLSAPAIAGAQQPIRHARVFRWNNNEIVEDPNAQAQALAKRVWWIDEEGGAVGNGMGNQRPAIEAAIAACPEGGTLGIPYGKFRLADRLVINKRINVQGNGSGSCLWVEQGEFPLPQWAHSYPGVQFGVPYSGFPGQSTRNVVGVHLSEFSVQGAADTNPRYGLGLFSVMHSRIAGIVSNARAARASTVIAGLNGTVVDGLLCDLQSPAGAFPEQTYFSGSPSGVVGNTLTLPVSGWTNNGVQRKLLTVVSGPGANSQPYRVVSNSGNVVSVAGWVFGRPTRASVVRVWDAAGGYGGAEAHVILLDLSAPDAPFPGRPAGWGAGQDPCNANDFRFVLRGNGGDSGAGLLVEAQTAGGSNRFSGLFEGFADAGGRYHARYGVSKYCAKFLTCSGFHLTGHFENAGAGFGSTDPNVIIDGSCGNFELGPNITIDQRLRIINSTAFHLAGGVYNSVELVRIHNAGNGRWVQGREGVDWSRSIAAYIGSLVNA